MATIKHSSFPAASNLTGFAAIGLQGGVNKKSPSTAFDALDYLAASGATNGIAARLGTVSKSANYTATATDLHILCDATAGAFTITLPAAGSTMTGRVFIITKTDSGSNAITIDGNASETIDAALTFTLAAQYDTVVIQSDGTNWKVLVHKTARRLVEVVTATNVITAAESGKTFFLNSATEFVSTLPAAAAGLWFRFVVAAAPSGASYTIVTDSSANIIKGHVLSSDLNAAGDADTETSGGDTISFVDGKAVAGDWVEVESDGTNWFVTGGCAVFDAITITTAS